MQSSRTLQRQSRAKWTAELSAREAALTQREEAAAAAAARRQQEDLRKRAAHNEQVICTKYCQVLHASPALLISICFVVLDKAVCGPLVACSA